MAREELFRSLPKVDRLADDPKLAEFPEPVRVLSARAAIGFARLEASAGRILSGAEIADSALNEALRLVAPSLGRVLNFSGVVLHTGLGRARLAPAAVEALRSVGGAYARLEFGLEDGERGDRQDHVRELLCDLTGSASALVVNNAAAGVVLALAALAEGTEVLLSRGQMVEIGGAFRMPDIVRQSGGKLVEVGTTNRTRLSDYRSAIRPGTGAILRCHPSNFSIVGFTEEVPPSDLGELAAEHGLSFIDDQGSGLLLDTAPLGIGRQPTVQDSVQANADLVVASCDKLLGGPQAGMIVGQADAIKRAKSHPLARAFRIDKLSLIALEATLKLYRDGKVQEIPTWRYLYRSLDETRAMAEELASAWQGDCEVALGGTEVGSGSAPGSAVATYRLGLRASSSGQLAKQLRLSDPAIIPRIERGIVWLDPRTVEPDELAEAKRILARIEP